jgi:hypothetical protein
MTPRAIQKSLYTTLSNLVVLAEEVITRPRFDRITFGGRLSDLAVEVRSADARPAEDVRTTQVAMVMIICLEEIRDRNEDAAMHWRMLAGASLPMLRGDAWLAMKQEREQR